MKYAFVSFSDEFIHTFPTKIHHSENLVVLNSIPIMLAKGSRSRKTKVAKETAKFEYNSFRQPIENFFSWIIAMTGIQDKSKNRSKEGLLVHTFGRFAAAIILLALR